jgi:uncharacterized protein (TIGR02246 family)
LELKSIRGQEAKNGTPGLDAYTVAVLEGTMTMQRNLTTVVMALLVLGSAAGVQTKNKGMQTPAGSDEIRAVLERLYTAWSDLDPAKAAPFYAKDADLTFFDITPMKYTGWMEYAAGVPKAFAAYQSGKFTLNDDLGIHRHGNLAWATATWRAELTKKDGAKENAEGRYIAVLEKRGNQWLLVHEHMSAPAPPQ